LITPYSLEIIENCVGCKIRSQNTLCDLPRASLEAFESIKYPTAYPKGAVLFVEGQMPRGVFVLCKGRVRLSLCSSTGKTLIMKIVEPGEVLGLSATITGKPYEVMAETTEPCQVNFVRREDFLRFLRQHSEAGLRVAQQLSAKYNAACRDIRMLSLSHSSNEKLAKLLLDRSAETHQMAKTDIRVNLKMTHEEIGQMIGTSRETVSRHFAEWKKRNIVQNSGSILLIRNIAALKAMVSS
jgi:CRP/FNR family transcriptional regulator, cyclic AMP receptor protein